MYVIRGLNRSHFFLPLILIVITTLSFCTSCSPERNGKDMGTNLDIITDGALVVNSEMDTYHIRAYEPEITLQIKQESEIKSTITIILENIPADSINAKISLPVEKEDKASLYAEPASSTELLLTVEGGLGPQTIELTWKENFLASPVTFAVLGDNQGNNDVLSALIEEINQSEASFLVHLGDMVPSGKKNEYHDFLETMSFLKIPWFSVPGNHDVRGDGLSLYNKLIAPAHYNIELHGYRFFFLDTSELGMDEAQKDWLMAELDEEKKNLLFMHVPLNDPRGREHAFLDREQAQSLFNLVRDPARNVKGVFAGHIHMFHQQQIEGITFAISGGGGAPFYAPPNEGGFYHFALVSLQGEEVKVTPYPVEAPERGKEIVVTGKDGDVEFTLQELQGMAVVEKEGQFQNVHGNFRGEGIYKGVPVRDLLEQAGGLEPDDLLVVHSWDGYRQEFSYKNVYPEEFGWYEYQGDMVVAIEYDGTTLPEWREGHRIVFLPEDGVFDNDDLINTSEETEEEGLYLSAGSRWVKMVSRLEVIPGTD